MKNSTVDDQCIDWLKGIVIDGVDQTESDTFQEWYVKERKIPLGRPGDAEEIASAAVFLASEECSYITGHVLVVDGGLTITF